MSIPKDGYYMARVQYDTGGTLQTYVHVQNGIIRSNSGNELRAEACSEFSELGTLPFCAAWPERAAMELEALRNEVTTLRKDNWVGAACLHLLAEHGVPIGSTELLAAKDRVEAEIQTLRTANAGLVEKVKRLEKAGDAHREWVPVSFQNEWEKAKGQP